jgi:hypothetical protein
MWRDGEGKRAGAAGMTCFQGLSEACAQHLSAKRAPWMEPGPIRQDCGTIDVRSNGETITSGDGEWRSPLRSNSIRRSKAVERIIG